MWCDNHDTAYSETPIIEPEFHGTPIFRIIDCTAGGTLYQNPEKGNVYYDERRHPRRGAPVADMERQKDGNLPGQRTGIISGYSGRVWIFCF